jgi:hypothetical protein
MSNKKEDSHLQPYVDRAIEALIKIDSISIKAVDVAIRANQMIDPDNTSVALVTFGCNMHLRGMARSSLRGSYNDQDIKKGPSQGTLFDRLQVMYPTKRDGEESYVKRQYLTVDERRYNANRLRKEAIAKIEHANLLDAETDELIQQGELTK